MALGRSIHDLGSPALSWIELRAMVRHAPPDAAFRQVADPLAAYHTAEARLLSLTVDTLAGANWQRGGGKGPRPKPLMDQLRAHLASARAAEHAPTSIAQMDRVRAELAARRKRARPVAPPQ